MFLKHSVRLKNRSQQSVEENVLPVKTHVSSKIPTSPEIIPLQIGWLASN